MRTIRTPENAAKLLEAVASCGGNVTKACEVAGIGRTAVYAWLNDDAAFKAEYEQALERGIDRLEDEMIRRGFEGVDEPIYYLGERVDTVRKYSDTLLIFALKNRRAAIYGDRTKVEHSGGLGISLPDVRSMTLDEIDRRIAELRGEGSGAGAASAAAVARGKAGLRGKSRNVPP